MVWVSMVRRLFEVQNLFQEVQYYYISYGTIFPTSQNHFSKFVNVYMFASKFAYFHLLLSSSYLTFYLLNGNCPLLVKSQGKNIKQRASFPKTQLRIL